MPDREQFRSFQTVGLSGIDRLDANNRAAGLECYLQLDVLDIVIQCCVKMKEADAQSELELMPYRRRGATA